MNTIRELKQQEKYKTMLKRKNKEKKIYKDKNASLQFEKQKLYRTLLNREREIERLNRIIKEVREYIKSFGSDSDRKNYSLYYNEIINKVLEILDKEINNE